LLYIQHYIKPVHFWLNGLAIVRKNKTDWGWSPWSSG